MKKKKILSELAVSVLLTLEAIATAYFISGRVRSYIGEEFVVTVFLLCALLFAAILIVCHFFGRAARAVAFPVGAILLCLTVAALFVFRPDNCYRQAAEDKAAVFSGHRVMLIVPHEDDDINVLGGVIEEYTGYGSEVTVVFVTNGDYKGLGETRINEAVACMERCGVPEERVVFLGYGNQWEASGPHIYNAPPDTVIRSHIGYTHTYGSSDHAPFHESDYTAENYLNDLRDVLLTFRPDVIFCTDYDGHIDHRAVSLGFEKALGRILAEETDYRPAVLKGFAYSTAWSAAPDFYALNMLSTVQPDRSRDNMPDCSAYLWSGRLRLPVKASALSRYIRASDVYKELDEYRSQNAYLNAVNIINGDRVFWERSTASLSYTAGVSASSGNASLVNDFMLYDNAALTQGDRQPGDGVWIPEADDTGKSVTLTLDAPSYIETIRLYDNPSAEDNVLGVKIVLDSGKELDGGRPDPLGVPTEISVGEENVRSVTVILESTEGSYAGLSEVELFSSSPRGSFDLIKLTDEDGSFAYDHVVPKHSVFTLYHAGEAPELSAENYTVSCSNEKCRVGIVDDRIELSCPRGETAIITVTDQSGLYSDSIYVSNRINLIPFWQRIDAALQDAIALQRRLEYRLNEVLSA